MHSAQNEIFDISKQYYSTIPHHHDFYTILPHHHISKQYYSIIPHNHSYLTGLQWDTEEEINWSVELSKMEIYNCSGDSQQKTLSVRI